MSLHRLGHQISFIRWCSGVVHVFSGIGLKKSCQSEVKPKSILTFSHMLSSNLPQLHVFVSSFEWFPGFSVFFVFDQSDNYCLN